jgi:hypothetical protein
MFNSRFIPLMARIGRTLNEAEIPYMVIGGQAVIHHGELRATKDVDFTLAISPFDAGRLIALLERCGLEPLYDDPAQFVRESHLLPCRSRTVPLRVDFAFTDTPYEQQAIARGEDVMIEGVPVRFASVEDLLVHKLLAWRPQDQKDIETILLKNPEADLDEVRYWCGQFEQVLEEPVADRLDQALRQIQD